MYVCKFFKKVPVFKSVFKLVKKYLQGQCPQYFKEYFKRNNTIHARATRQSNLLHAPAVRTRSQNDSSITMVALFLTNYLDGISYSFASKSFICT